MRNRKLGWILLRAVLFFSGISLIGYVLYRYAFSGSPPEAGTVYGVIFPSSVLLGVLAITLAFRPGLFRGADGAGGWGIRGGVFAFGAVWMATGLLCVQSLTQGILESPVFGTLNFLHMVSHHVVIPAGLGLLVAVPGAVLAWAGDDEDRGTAVERPSRGDVLGG